jgi:hypothetical protein
MIRSRHSGELFRVEVGGELRVTRMEHLWGEGYYSIDRYKLRDGMHATWAQDRHLLHKSLD